MYLPISIQEQLIMEYYYYSLLFPVVPSSFTLDLAVDDFCYFHSLSLNYQIFSLKHSIYHKKCSKIPSLFSSH